LGGVVAEKALVDMIKVEDETVLTEILKSLVKIAEALGVSRDLIYQKIDQGKIFTKSRLLVTF